MAEGIRHLTGAELEELVSSSDRPVVVDFSATWCGPCKVLAPVVTAYAAKHGEVDVVGVDVDESNDAARRFNIMSVPTVVVLRDGAEVGRMVGARPLDQLEAVVTSALA